MLYLNNTTEACYAIYLGVNQSMTAQNAGFLDTFSNTVSVCLDNVLLNIRLGNHAFTDPLTNLPNRLKLLHMLDQILAQKNQSQTILALIDIDHFAETNNALGHHFGDLLLCAVAEQSAIPPHLLDLEINESMAMEDPAALMEILHELKKIGVKISIDDFGTGFSSLNYLKQLPIDQLKIDPSFINQIVDANRDASIPKMIIHLCESLGLTVIAKGVEELAQAQKLVSIGYPLAQDFYYSKPLETLKLGDWLDEDRNQLQRSEQSAEIT